MVNGRSPRSRPVRVACSGGVLSRTVVPPTVGEHLNSPVHGNRQRGAEGQHVDDNRDIGIDIDGGSPGESPVESDGVGKLLVGRIHMSTFTRMVMWRDCCNQPESNFEVVKDDFTSVRPSVVSRRSPSAGSPLSDLGCRVAGFAIRESAVGIQCPCSTIRFASTENHEGGPGRGSSFARFYLMGSR